MASFGKKVSNAADVYENTQAERRLEDDYCNLTTDTTYSTPAKTPGTSDDIELKALGKGANHDPDDLKLTVDLGEGAGDPQYSHYDYLKPSVDQYEEIPLNKSPGPGQNGTKTKQIVHSRPREQSPDHRVSDTSLRRRINPVYGTSGSVSQASYDTKPPDPYPTQYVRCLGAMCFIFFLVATVSLGISIYVLLNPQGKDPIKTTVSAPQVGEQKSPIQNDIDELQLQLAALQEEVQNLVGNVSQMDNTVSGLSQNITEEQEKREEANKAIQNVLNQLEQKIIQNTERINTTQDRVAALSDNVSSIEDTVDNFTQKIMTDIQLIETEWSSFNISITTLVTNISKSDGPVGPQGLQGETGRANFSSCSYVVVSEDGPSDVNSPHFTPYSPTKEQNDDNIVLGATCSVIYGTNSNIETNSDLGFLQYRCGCGGIVPAQNFPRICKLHLWMCRRLVGDAGQN